MNSTIPAVSVVPLSTNLPDSLVNTKLKVGCLHER